MEIITYQEFQGDLFSATNDFALCHCVSRDFNMGKGIATIFKNRYGRVEELKAQNANIGGCAFLNDNGKFLFYLVTKEKYFQKPTYESLAQSLVCMKNHCLRHGVTKIAMPKIGCGLDKLVWNRVREMILDTFSNSGIAIRVYSI